jgi:hypothetical protein
MIGDNRHGFTGFELSETLGVREVSVNDQYEVNSMTNPFSYARHGVVEVK